MSRAIIAASIAISCATACKTPKGQSDGSAVKDITVGETQRFSYKVEYNIDRDRGQKDLALIDGAHNCFFVVRKAAGLDEFNKFVGDEFSLLYYTYPNCGQLTVGFTDEGVANFEEYGAFLAMSFPLEPHINPLNPESSDPPERFTVLSAPRNAATPGKAIGVIERRENWVHNFAKNTVEEQKETGSAIYMFTKLCPDLSGKPTVATLKASGESFTKVVEPMTCVINLEDTKNPLIPKTAKGADHPIFNLAGGIKRNLVIDRISVIDLKTNSGYPLRPEHLSEMRGRYFIELNGTTPTHYINTTDILGVERRFVLRIPEDPKQTVRAFFGKRLPDLFEVMRGIAQSDFDMRPSGERLIVEDFGILYKHMDDSVGTDKLTGFIDVVGITSAGKRINTPAPRGDKFSDIKIKEQQGGAPAATPAPAPASGGEPTDPSYVPSKF